MLQFQNYSEEKQSLQESLGKYIFFLFPPHKFTTRLSKSVRTADSEQKNRLIVSQSAVLSRDKKTKSIQKEFIKEPILVIYRR